MRLSVDNLEDFTTIENLLSISMSDSRQTTHGWMVTKREWEFLKSFIDCLVEIKYIPSCNYATSGWQKQVETRGGRIFYRGEYMDNLL